VATESGNPGGTSPTPTGGGSESNRSQVGSNKGSSPANGGDSKASAPKSGTGQGSPGGGSAEHNAAQPQQGSQVGSTASESGDDSSPLVPILVAILVLAAISLGAVMLRRRRQAGGPSVSPEAS
jgi:cobalamin biosynthesis Mg chelatase CobN